jgi:tungstate transport system permease protein
MDFYLESLSHALRLLWTLDPEVAEIASRSLRLSTTATLLASCVGIPAGVVIALANFSGKKGVITILSALMGVPTVVVGLLLYSLFSRRGILGAWGLLFTPTAIVVAEWILSTPIITRLTIAAVRGVDPRVHATALTLGASRTRAYAKVLGEARGAVFAAVITGFGRAITEVGAAMMVGGNIRGTTRTLTTAIALETAKGELALALSLGLILLGIFLVLNFLFLRLQEAA